MVSILENEKGEEKRGWDGCAHEKKSGMLDKYYLGTEIKHAMDLMGIGWDIWSQ